MLPALDKLNDIDGLKRCFEEWESSCSSYDRRLANVAIDSALKCMEAAVSAAKDNERHPKPERINFSSLLRKRKDVNGAEEFCKMLKKVNHLDSKAYLSLLHTYVPSGKPTTDMLRRMKADGIEMNLDIENFLERVCPR
ncbi:tetratricopeptide repeat (TPR)-like superfamily protein [Actinidia rufa]|uniref:Tetratricopeptide repeat (TPR)-like superfamily protein n=1 Tax=Actinidia rufa TaxID=165716 RepID=A0A7J0H876_9ERIC|nr:tetratricopeptide repeat (TPR)-like superfamily protein [Actinidia rufa]